MKAMTYSRYGSPSNLKWSDVESPKPGDSEVLIKVHAASLNAYDWHIMRGEPFLARIKFGLSKPRVSVLGADVAGTVEAVGKNVTRFKIGDEVFGDVSSCRIGGFAEYVCALEGAITHKPKNVSFSEAAAAPMAAVTALQSLHQANITTGKEVLINGASGGVGTFAVQIAKVLGGIVTAVCSTSKVEMVRDLGADFVTDYTKEDFAQNGKKYDLILGANGNTSIFAYKNSLSSAGSYLMTGGSNTQMFQGVALGPLVSLGSNKKLSGFLMKPSLEDLQQVGHWLEAGVIHSVIDRVYPLQELGAAMMYLEEGHAKGKIVISVAEA